MPAGSSALAQAIVCSSLLILACVALLLRFGCARRWLSVVLVATLLDQMSQLMELDGANPFEVRAYQNASRAIAGLEGDIVELVGGPDEATQLGLKLSHQG